MHILAHKKSLIGIMKDNAGLTVEMCQQGCCFHGWLVNTDIIQKFNLTHGHFITSFLTSVKLL